jgi:hypothetical protein
MCEAGNVPEDIIPGVCSGDGFVGTAEKAAIFSQGQGNLVFRVSDSGNSAKLLCSSRKKAPGIDRIKHNYPAKYTETFILTRRT